jgi:hypothetical protein
MPRSWCLNSTDDRSGTRLNQSLKKFSLNDDSQTARAIPQIAMAARGAEHTASAFAAPLPVVLLLQIQQEA